MHATIRIFADQTTTHERDVQSVAQARGIAKLALRRTPYHWEWSRVWVAGQEITIRKAGAGWNVATK